MKKIFPKQVILDAIWKDVDENAPLRFHHESKWIDDGKYQYQEVILIDQDGNFWLYDHSKSGSYFTEYTYGYEFEPDEIELTQVHEVEVVKKDWVPKED